MLYNKRLNSFNRPNTTFKENYSLYILIIFSLLMGFGLISLYSATVNQHYFSQQLKYIFISFFFLIAFGWFFSIQTIETLAYPCFAVTILCLIYVLFFGYSAGGAQRWISFGQIRIQPSEFAKLTSVFFIAKFFHNKPKNSYQLYDIWPAVMGLLILFILIFKQPDFGTAGLCLLIGGCLFSFVRIHISKLLHLIFLCIFLLLSSITWKFFLHSYQKLRILNLLNPKLDPSGSGYNSIQSLIAVGSGKLWGKGFMQGTQTHLHFLPARHTDFIFSVIAEEQGFFVCCFIFILFYLLAATGLNIAIQSQDSFKRLTAVGCSAIIFIEFFINISMVLGLFPVVGMPLPFFSYGGSSLLTLYIALGILIAIDRHNNYHKNKLLSKKY